MSRVRTRCLMARAHGRASWYVISDMGADVPGRWHDWQLFCKIGATSLLKVTGLSSAAAYAVSPPARAQKQK